MIIIRHSKDVTQIYVLADRRLGAQGVSMQRKTNQTAETLLFFVFF